MKQLQKDTTTPEQSQRLLELGVPKWTANYKHPFVPCSDGSLVLDMDNVVSCNELCDGEIPLWSVGRLMEICKICGSYELAKEIYGRALFYKDIVDGVVCEMAHEVNIGNIDFKKLKD